MNFLFVCAFVIITTFSIYVSPVFSASLYSPDDPLWELDTTNFKRVILNKSNIWIVEFYNNWCGHCIRFAPAWKAFSRDTRTWRNVVDVAVVNCAESQNVNLCRDYDINGFPTIKLFEAYANETEIGEALTGNRDINSMEISIINFLEAHWNDKGKWPTFDPIDVSTVRRITKSMADNEESVLLFIESPDSFIGRKVILDLSFQRSVSVRRVLTTNTALLRDLDTKIENSSLPVVLKLYRDGKEELVHRFSEDFNSTYIRDQIFESIVGRARNKPGLQVFNPKKNSHAQVSTVSSVYMTDLENAIYYSLTQEIGVVKYINEEKFSVLKSYLSVLKDHFPGPPHVIGFLAELHKWVSAKTDNITGEEFVQAMNNLKGSEIYLPKMRDWVGCKGSEPRYRGYPCSLWTLFHTLTIQAENMFEDAHGYMKKHGTNVLFTIRDYVKNFFTCEECSQNFVKMAENLEDEVSTARDAALWLWNAHNRVNRRLAGDVTEDPKHPKVQFPTKEMCGKCRIEEDESGNIQWDKALVLRYLQHFYGKDNIINSQVPQVKEALSVDQIAGLENSSMVIHFKNVSYFEKWSFKWFTFADISLCVSLYLVSALLIIIIFLFFRQRKRRRKFAKYVTLYP